MSHGSQRALVLMANLETRITGVHTMATDLPNSMTTRAVTPLPRQLKNELVGRSLAHQVQSPKFWVLSIISSLSVLQRT